MSVHCIHMQTDEQLLHLRFVKPHLRCRQPKLFKYIAIFESSESTVYTLHIYTRVQLVIDKAMEYLRASLISLLAVVAAVSGKSYSYIRSELLTIPWALFTRWML